MDFNLLETILYLYKKQNQKKFIKRKDLRLSGEEEQQKKNRIFS
jgi:hypothetical protein